MSPAAAWGGTTVGAAAASFAGAYEAPLLWQPAVGGFQERLQLTLFYAGGSVRRDCNGRLAVPVTVTLTTSESGISESGEATLAIAGSSAALVGDLSYAGERVALEASLSEAAAGVSLSGEITSLDQGLPSASASFAVEP